ncbi:MAG: ISKra4 family transposase [Candidatus Solibacter sp.]
MPGSTGGRHTHAAGKKTAEIIQQEVAKEISHVVQLVFSDWHKTGTFDLDSIEVLVRNSMHHAGAVTVQQLLRIPEAHSRQIPCACGQQAQYHETRRKQILTMLGPVVFDRAYYLCPGCHQGQSPRDRELDVVGKECSPGVRRMMAAVGSDTSFESGRQQLRLLAGIEVTTKAVERHAEAIGADIVGGEQARRDRVVQLQFPDILGVAVPVLYIELDGTQLPMVRGELTGRVGRNPGQPARTREAKLGCVFTQTGTDLEGRPIRDPASTTYTGAIETAELFGRRLYAEAWERGWDRARKKVVLGDGAEWIWNIAAQHFAGAIQIVDIWHAREHLWDLAAKLFASDEKPRKSWAKKLIKKLNGGRIEAVVSDLRNFPTRKPELRESLRIEADYFERNRDRMRYPKFRKQGLFIGSGVIEAGCKTVIGSRLKQSGMFWTVRGANAIIALRCTRLSGKFEDYWVSGERAA